MLKASHRILYLILTMAILGAVYNCFLPLHPDEAYYWQWSRHLDLSYYDGPPLMAYLIRLSTTLFGTSAFTVKLPAVLCMSVGLLAITKLAQKMTDEKTAWIALTLLLPLPIVQAGFVISTLDPALFCFWSLSLYSFYVAVFENKNSYRYLTGFFVGLTFLAKYTGIFLPLGFLIFLFFSRNYWREFKNVHWIFAGLLALLVASPVLIWNIQHDFIAFSYQYHHGVADQKVFQWSMMGYFIGTQMAIVNPIFFGMIFVVLGRYWRFLVTPAQAGVHVPLDPSLRWDDGKKMGLRYLTILFLTPFLFFFYQSWFQLSLANWAAPAYISITIVVAYFMVKYNYRKTYIAMMSLSLLLLCLLRFPFLFPLPNNAVMISKFMGYSQLFSQVAPLEKAGEPIIANSIQVASEAAFYLPGQPETYILDDWREYQFWSADLEQAILAGKIKSALFVVDPADDQDVSKYFKKKQLLKTVVYQGKWDIKTLDVYRVWN